MHIDEPLFPSGTRMAAAGSFVWLLLVGGEVFSFFRLSIFDLLFLLAPWVVVPLVLSLVPAAETGRIPRIAKRILQFALFPGAALATVSFFLRDGRTAGVLTGLWLLVAGALAVDGLARLARTRMQSFPEFCFAVGEGYALVGALWLLASRLGLQPVGFHEPIVLLTAVHFHFAGLMAAVLAALAASKQAATRSPLALRIALLCAVLGPGLLGLAFLVGPKLKLAAMGLMVVGELAIAFGTSRIGWAEARTVGGRLLLAGSACVIFGMALAAIWAVGEYPLHAFVNLEQMARYHGVLNSIGFGLCSLVGWTLLRGRPQGSRGQA
jgi:hypothetical protein